MFPVLFWIQTRFSELKREQELNIYIISVPTDVSDSEPI